ncbi:7318_t:CDS:1, partial [Cetraspora pellucida]
MFKTTFAKVSLIKHVIELTRKLVTNINIEFTKSGINFTSIDLSYIVLISVHLDKKSFEKY